jgi:uncharacterized protein YaiI (UPF0178 family)
MQLLIDADACPVVEQTISAAKHRGIPVTLFCDTSHLFYSDYATVRTVGTGRDAADFAIVTACRAGDLVVTQDYGVAAMVLGKGACAIHQSGMRYTLQNIDALLMERHLAKKERMSKTKNHPRGPAKRTRADDLRFDAALEALLNEMLP